AGRARRAERDRERLQSRHLAGVLAACGDDARDRAVPADAGGVPGRRDAQRGARARPRRPRHAGSRQARRPRRLGRRPPARAHLLARPDPAARAVRRRRREPRHVSCARGIVRAAALACTFLAGAAFAEPPPRELVIEDVTVVSPERGEPLAHANVLVRDGRIAAVSTRPLEASHTIDGRGRFLVPGLIDSHVHLGEAPGVTPLQAEAHPELVRAARAQEPRSYLYFGFTTVVDLISDPERTARWRAAPDRPDVVSCGAAPIANGYPMAWVPEDLRFRLARYFLYDPRPPDRIPGAIDPAVHTPEAVVRRMAADGAVCVKTFHETGFGGLHDLPTPTLEMARALVAAAHERGMPVLMHANSVAAQRFALEAGADVIAHGLWNGFEVDGDGFSNGADGVLEAISAKGIGWQPTMQVLQGLSDLFDETFLDRPAVRHAYPQALIDWYRTPEGRWFHDEIASGLGGADGRAVFASVLERIRAVVPVVARGDATLLFG